MCSSDHSLMQTKTPPAQQTSSSLAVLMFQLGSTNHKYIAK